VFGYDAVLIMDVGRIFSSEANGGFLRRLEEPTGVKCHFANSKLRENYFPSEMVAGKYHVSKSMRT